MTEPAAAPVAPPKPPRQRNPADSAAARQIADPVTAKAPISQVTLDLVQDIRQANRRFPLLYLGLSESGYAPISLLSLSTALEESTKQAQDPKYCEALAKASSILNTENFLLQKDRTIGAFIDCLKTKVEVQPGKEAFGLLSLECHALAISLKLNQDGNYIITIYNSGGGLKKFHTVSPNGEKHSVSMSYTITSDNIETMIERSNVNCYQTIAKLYEKIQMYANKNVTPGKFRARQKNGNCTASILDAVLKHHLTEAEYLRYKLSMLDYMKKNLMPKSYQADNKYQKNASLWPTQNKSQLNNIRNQHLQLIYLKLLKRAAKLAGLQKCIQSKKECQRREQELLPLSFLRVSNGDLEPVTRHSKTPPKKPNRRRRTSPSCSAAANPVSMFSNNNTSVSKALPIYRYLDKKTGEWKPLVVTLATESGHQGSPVKAKRVVVSRSPRTGA